MIRASGEAESPRWGRGFGSESAQAVKRGEKLQERWPLSPKSWERQTGAGSRI